MSASTSQHSRRTVLKAGLWTAPAIAVVHLSAGSAQAASGTTAPQTTYPSHGFLVFLVNEDVGGKTVPVYYAFKFGNGSAMTPVVGEYNQAKDGAYLAKTSPYAGNTIIGKDNVGTADQMSTWDTLRKAINVATFSNSTGSGYVLTSAPAGLVGAYVFDGSIGGDKIAPVQATSKGQFLFTKVA